MVRILIFFQMLISHGKVIIKEQEWTIVLKIDGLFTCGVDNKRSGIWVE